MARSYSDNLPTNWFRTYAGCRDRGLPGGVLQRSRSQKLEELDSNPAKVLGFKTRGRNHEGLFRSTVNV